MLTKFISVSETRFQNTKTVLKNQQALIQGLKNQIGQLAKLISERPQGSLPSNTETNPREQLHAIIILDEEGSVDSKPEPRQEGVVRDQVFLDKTDPRVVTSKSNADRATPFTVLTIFPYDTVEVTLTKFERYIMTNTRGKSKVAVSSSATAEVRHPYLRFSMDPPEDLFQLLRVQPLGLGRCIEWAALE
ncbi:hypothetical protein GOBAR_AA06255 [Gossypium barbadense]|uniref:Uncharacterized protein n=1 Tax=Gossypium barbadense TaxID=3634 RepID=A0A2P5YFK9_GOSBA|nr:hypothetical protein GOBAR_AA06255 [Gossypium barbadense]